MAFINTLFPADFSSAPSLPIETLEKEDATACRNQFFHSMGLGFKNKNTAAAVQWF